MKDTNFTPGPWKLASFDTLVSDTDGEFVEIAVFRKDDDWEVEQRANKTLIAQAPALHDALAKMLALYGHSRCRVSKAAHQTLAAARGEKI